MVPFDNVCTAGASSSHYHENRVTPFVSLAILLIVLDIKRAGHECLPDGEEQQVQIDRRPGIAASTLEGCTRFSSANHGQLLALP
jgi:hypothetical protein